MGTTLNVSLVVVLLVALLAGWWLQRPAPELVGRPINEAFDSRVWFGETMREWGNAVPVPVRLEDRAVKALKTAATVAPEELAWIRDRVADSRSIKGVGGASRARATGVSPKYVEGLVDYWLSAYDWTTHAERKIKRWRHLVTDVDGLRIHTVVSRGSGAKNAPRNAIPIVLLHGWPSSFWEFHRIIDALADPTDNATAPVFDVIVPSLPGFVYSEAAALGDVGVYETAAIIHELLVDRLKVPKYYVHGGDIGALVAQALAQMFPNDILGVHLTMNPGRSVLSLGPSAVLQLGVGALLGPAWVLPDPVDQAKMYPLGKKLVSLWDESSFYWQAAANPDTLAYALSQSPAALAALVADKFHAWSDEHSITRDDIITTSILLYSTNSVASSLRWFRHMRDDPLLAEGSNCAVPVPVGFVSTHLHTGLSLAESVPKPWAAYKFPHLVSYTELATGGHYAALESPREIIQDIRSFVLIVEASRK